MMRDVDPSPPPGLIDRLNRVADIEYALADTERARLRRRRVTISGQMTMIERKAARLWETYRELGELLEAINDRLDDDGRLP